MHLKSPLWELCVYLRVSLSHSHWICAKPGAIYCGKYEFFLSGSGEEKEKQTSRHHIVVFFFPKERFYSVSQTNNLSKPLYFRIIIKWTFNLLTRCGTTAVHFIPVLKKHFKKYEEKRQTISFSFSPS